MLHPPSSPPSARPQVASRYGTYVHFSCPRIEIALRHLVILFISLIVRRPRHIPCLRLTKHRPRPRHSFIQPESHLFSIRQPRRNPRYRRSLYSNFRIIRNCLKFRISRPTFLRASHARARQRGSCLSKSISSGTQSAVRFTKRGTSDRNNLFGFHLIYRVISAYKTTRKANEEQCPRRKGNIDFVTIHVGIIVSGQG